MIILRIEKSIFHIYPHIFTVLGALQVYIYITSPRLIFTMLGAPQSSVFFPSAWRTSLHVYCLYNQLAADSPSFCFYNLFISPSILEDVTTEYRIQDWHFFLYFKDAIPLSFFLMSFAFLMSSLVILILFPWMWCAVFPLVVFKTFSLCLIFINLTMMQLCAVLFLFILLVDSLGSLEVWVYSFRLTWKNSGHFIYIGLTFLIYYYYFLLSLFTFIGHYIFKYFSFSPFLLLGFKFHLC